jgi:hypothetical protein
VIARALSILATLLCVGVLWFGVDWGFLKSEVTAYPIRCASVATESTCLWPDPGPQTTYRLLRDEQAVLVHTADRPVFRLSGCAILDRSNWTCSDEQDRALGFVEGRFFFSPDPADPVEAWRYHVSKWRYNWLRVATLLP